MEHNSKECAACGGSFTPTRSTQIYCPDCGHHGQRVIQKYEREVARSKRYQQLYAPEVFEHTCIICGKPFKTTYKDRRICSNRCAKNASKQKIRCTNCNILFTDLFTLDEIPDEEIRKHKHFCSDTCEHEFEQNKYSERICLQCGKPYRNSNTKFCCKQCHNDYTSTPKKPKIIIKPKQKSVLECFICKKTCNNPIRRQHPKSHTYINLCSENCLSIFDTQNQQNAEMEHDQKLKDYITKNGMCGICNTSYKDCERMQSNFRVIPKGARYIDNKIKVCPKFTTKFK